MNLRLSIQLLKYVLQISLLLMCFEGLGILAVGDFGSWLLTGLWISATTMFYRLETNVLLVAEIRVLIQGF